MEQGASSLASILRSIIDLLVEIDEEERTKVLRSVNAFFDHYSERRPPSPDVNSANRINTNSRPEFSEKLTPTVKEFLMQKAPRTDVERIACLAYYITHYQSLQFFKTIDLAKLNTEGAQPKFSNSSYASNNAMKMGYLVAGPSSTRQLSAAGERFVDALPDREAARAALRNARPRKIAKRK